MASSTVQKSQFRHFLTMGKVSNNDNSSAFWLLLRHKTNIMPPVDPRRVVGGSVWAKATAVSNDSRRIYGVDADKHWLRGEVVEVLVNRPEGARRATTLIRARYKVGDSVKDKILGLFQLKKEDPSVQTNAASNLPPPATTNNGAVNLSPPTDDASTTAPTGTTQAPGSSETTETGTSGDSSSTARIPVSVNHGIEWFTDPNTELPINGTFVRKTWKFTDQYTGQDYTPGCDPNKEISPLGYFMAVFPKKQLSLMVEETSRKLMLAGKPRLTKGELLKWFGIVILITRFEFGERDHLWRTKSTCKYIPAPNFGERTGMTRDRFNDLFRYMVWSRQPSQRPEGMSSETYRWKLIEDFIDNFNEHRSSLFLPGWLLCVDESMSRWYGLGGHWINMGLPMYVAIDRKPEDGLEIQNAACAHSGIMYQLKIVKTAESNAE